MKAEVRPKKFNSSEWTGMSSFSKSHRLPYATKGQQVILPVFLDADGHLSVFEPASGDEAGDFNSLLNDTRNLHNRRLSYILTRIESYSVWNQQRSPDYLILHTAKSAFLPAVGSVEDWSALMLFEILKRKMLFKRCRIVSSSTGFCQLLQRMEKSLQVKYLAVDDQHPADSVLQH